MMQLAGPNDGGWGYTKQDAGIQNGNTGWRFKILNEDTAGSKGGSVRRINDSDLSPASRVGLREQPTLRISLPIARISISILLFVFGCSFAADKPATTSSDAGADAKQLQVYEKAIADLQKWRVQIRANGIESQNTATWAMVVDVVKAFKAVADAAMSLTGEVGKVSPDPATKALAKAIKGGYDVANSALDAYYAHTGLARAAAVTSGAKGSSDVVAGLTALKAAKGAPQAGAPAAEVAGKILGPASETLKGINELSEGKDASATGHFVKVLGHITDLVGKTTAARYIKNTGSLVVAGSDLAAAGREAFQANGIRASQKENVGTMTEKIDAAIAALRARTFDPSTLSPAEKAAWRQNEAIVARETLRQSSQGSGSTSVSGRQQPADTSSTFDPSTLPPAAKAAWLQNQAIMARDTLSSSAPSSASGNNGRQSLDSSVTFDPSTLSPAERAARGRNQANMARETLSAATPGATSSGVSSSNGPELIDIISCTENGTLSVYTRGGRNCGQLMAPLNKGAVRQGNTGDPASKAQGASGAQFDPSTLSAAEKAARDRNQANIARETLGRSGSVPPPGDDSSTTTQFDPASLSAAEREAWLRNQAIVARETLKGTSSQDPASAISEILSSEAGTGASPQPPHSGASNSSPFGYPTSTRQSPDGRLTASMQWSFKDAGGPWPQATGTWAVYDRGRYVGSYSDVKLLADGKYEVLTSPGASALLTTDGTPRASVYTTYDAGLATQNQTFSQQNKDALANAGYRETSSFGGGVFAGTKGYNGWDLLDSQGNKVGDGGYAQTVALGGGAVAATRDPFANSGWDIFGPDGNRIGSGYHQVKPLVNGAFAVSNDPPGITGGSGWSILDAAGHPIGDGSYAYVEAQGGRIAVKKSLVGSMSYLSLPSTTPAAPPAKQTTSTTSVRVSGGVTHPNTPKGGVSLGSARDFGSDTGPDGWKASELAGPPASKDKGARKVVKH
jgi:hypothetical protein